MRTFVYVDGFNLYYGSIKGTKFHWLDLRQMCRLLLPGHNVLSIRYCTAFVSGRGDTERPVRQQAYLRALRTIPEIQISLGTFLSHTVRMRLASPTPGGPKFVDVIKTEEKGSDVNLATHLLHDAHLNRYDVAVVVSNDSDLLEPIRIVRGQLGKKVGVLNPQKHPSKAIVPEVDFIKQIRAGVLQASQFPDTLSDRVGLIHKPIRWR